MPRPRAGRPRCCLAFIGRIRNKLGWELILSTRGLLVRRERVGVYGFVRKPVSRAALGVKLDAEKTMLFCV